MIKRFLCVFGILIASSCSNDSDENIPDTIPPEVSFAIEGIDKSNGQPIVVSNEMLVKIEARDANGLKKVEAFIDNQKVGEDLEAPFQFTIDVSGYESKNTNLSSKYKDYTLKITATDNAGNTATSEQLLNIDNNAPSITGVSIEEGSIVNGDSYIVTFEATDNEEVSKSVISLNGEVVSEISDQENLFEFNTLELNDGANSIGIETFDLAGNSTLYAVNFIVDNTGPEINFQNVVEDMVIDEIVALKPSIQDAYSGIGSVTYSLGEQILYEVEEGVDYTWDFNPNDYPTGNTRIVVQATDGLGNVSSTEVHVEILRRLIVINIPEDFYDSTDTREKYVFASDNQGRPLAIEPILPESRTIILRTSENIAAGSEFMITFAYYILPNGSSVSTSSLTTIANISGLSEINLNTSLRAKPLDSKTVPAVGIEKSYQVTARGLSPLSNVQYKPNVGLPEDGEFTLSRKYDAGPKGLKVSKTFVYLRNSNTNTYKYTLLDWDIENITEIRQDMFTEEGVELRRYESEMSNENHKGTILKQFGYFNDYEYQNDIYQQYGSIGYSSFISPDNFYYFDNNVFHKKRYELTINDYEIAAIGSPDNFYPKTDLDFSYTFQNNELNLQAEGANHTSGAFRLAVNDGSWPFVNGIAAAYFWEFVFNSKSLDPLKIPELPEELKDWEINSVYEQKAFKLEQIKVAKYENLLDYKDYLDTVIKNNKKWYLVSPKRESVFKKEPNASYWNSFLIN